MELETALRFPKFHPTYSLSDQQRAFMDDPKPLTLRDRLALMDAKWRVSGVALPAAGLVIAVLAVDDWRKPILSMLGFEDQSSKDQPPLEKVTERDMDTYRELEQIKVDRRFREK